MTGSTGEFAHASLAQHADPGVALPRRASGTPSSLLLGLAALACAMRAHPHQSTL